MSSKTKMYKKSHIRDRKRQKTERKPTRQEIFLDTLDQLARRAETVAIPLSTQK